MKRNKDISKLFRDNQHKLDERPSRAAWDKLERKLDHRKVKNRTLLYRQLTMVAAVIALVSLVSVISLMVDKETSHNTQTAKNDTESPFVLTELSYSDKDQEDVYKIVEFQRKQTIRNSNPIVEGDRSKRLIVKDDIPMEYPNKVKDNSRNIAANFKEKKVNKVSEVATSTKDYKVVAEAEKMVTPPPPTTDYDLAEDIVVAYEAPVDAGNIAMEIKEEGDPIGYSTLEEADDYPVVASPPAPVATRSTTAGGSYSKKENVATYSDDAIVVQEATTIDPASNAISYSTNSISNTSVDQFQWLIGQWKDNNYKGASFENWQRTNEFTIEGKGVLVVNQDTTFTESMKIEKIGDDLYYILALDKDQTAHRFRLVTYTNQVAVFENENLAFPNQIILQKNNANNFTTTLQNTRPSQLNGSQIDYFSNRNVIQKEQIQRNLSKVEK